MRYIIHSAPPRQWYVEEFLIPSMLAQGIPESDILVRCDTEGKGNLQSCMESFQWCGENQTNGTWHLQDDVILCRNFAQRTREYNFGVVCGCVIKDWGPDYTKVMNQPVKQMWYSFQCMRIPDKIAGECAEWFFNVASKSDDYEYIKRIRRKKHDDDFFRFFLFEKYPQMDVINLKPNLVDHIDYVIGGSLINANREKDINRACWFEDQDLVEKLELKIEQIRKEKKREHFQTDPDRK